MEVKTFFLAVGLGAVTGTAIGMMLPRSRNMQNLGRQVAHTACDTVSRAADTVERKMY